MKFRFGFLMMGVSVIALAGCNTGGTSSFNALLGSGTVTAGEVSALSDAGSDKKTTATVEYDDDNTTGDYTDDTATVSVKNGGAVAGPTDYVYDTDHSQLGSTESTKLGTAGFGVFEPETPASGQESILVAGIDGDAFSGFVGANSTTTGVGNVATGYGSLSGDGPSGIMPTSAVEYEGGAAAVVQKVGDGPYYSAGTADINANFNSGDVYGSFDFADDNGPFVGFTGSMSGSKATFASNAVSLNGIPGSGTVAGGFFGANYVDSSGIFDVSGADGLKATGSYVADRNQ